MRQWRPRAARKLIVALEAATLDLDALALSAAPRAPGPASGAHTTAAPLQATLQDVVQDVVQDSQRRAISQAQTMHQNNWAAAARQLGLDASNLHKLARRLGLKIESTHARRTA